MEQKTSNQFLKTALPLLLGGAILYWMYRDFDFQRISHVLWHEMDWTWMLLSFPFGILAQMMRGWRWKQTVEPIVSRCEVRGARCENSSEVSFRGYGDSSRYEVRGTRYENSSEASFRGCEDSSRCEVRGARYEDSARCEDSAGAKSVNNSAMTNLVPRTSYLAPRTPIVRTSVCVNAVFVSYAASLVVPRIGEFTRCGLLKRWEGISFSKALGTVVTERAVDTLTVLLYSGIILLFQLSTFGTFFRKTGTSMDHILSSFSLTGWLVTAVCGIAALTLLHLLMRNLSIYNKVKTTLGDIWEGVLSLRGIDNLPLYLFYTIGIWGCYFLHFYLTFFCFDFTAGLGIGCALVCFIVGNFAVIVPTPNGAGPWHFAVKTMLILYGVADEQALYFVLIVHTVQTLLVILLGIWGWARVSFLEVRG